ncbi:MAG: PPC domain-containing protein [Planctomycetaceae bacterium]
MTDAGLTWRSVFGTPLCAAVLTLVTGGASAAPPDPLLTTVFPAGCSAGTTTELTLSGTDLEELRTVQCNADGVAFEFVEANRVRISVPDDAVPGYYDIRAVTSHGISSPRTFVISHQEEFTETEPNSGLPDAQRVPMNAVINGQISESGDADCFRFDAVAGQRVIIDCAARRIDSQLRAVLKVFSDQGRQLAVNRGYFGVDPLIDFEVPADGPYIVQVQDLTSAGGGQHLYRLDISSTPRVLFTRPDIIQYGQSAKVELFGWNLSPGSKTNIAPSGTLQTVTVHLRAPPKPSASGDSSETVYTATSSSPAIAQRPPASAAVSDEFAWHLPHSSAAITFGLTDVPVVVSRAGIHSPESAQNVQVPCIVAGQLAELHQQDWFAFDARRGEVFHIEVIADRLQSPVDPEISVCDETGDRELACFRDEVRNIGGTMCSTSHLDPCGRWVAPVDGRFLINVRNIGGGAARDPRRIYRLSVRREEPGFQLVAVPRRDGFGRVNLRRGGREILDIVALRQRGFSGAIRISADDLPSGVECPDVWLGPDVERGVIVVSADQAADDALGVLRLTGTAEGCDAVSVRSATVVRPDTPQVWSRLTSQTPLAVTGDAPLAVTASAEEILEHHIYGPLQVEHAPGSVLDVAVQIDRRDGDQGAPVRLSAVGLPALIRDETAVIPQGQHRGYISFYLPPSLAPGRYSLAIQAETTVPTPDQKSEQIVAISNAVTFRVKPAAFLIEADRFAPKVVQRGETFQIRYASRRQNGFIGKMHTELAAPGVITNVPGLRSRGETFVGQTDTGSLQIEVNADAPLGHQQFLRLFTVGVVEDEPVFFGSCFVPLEVVE